MSVIRTIIVTLLATAALSSGASLYARAIEVPARLRLTVALCDSEGTQDFRLAAAEQVAADVYRDIGIAIQWAEGCASDGQRLVVRMLPGAMAEIELADEAVGYAEPGSFEAVVLYDRVNKFARRFRIRREVFLGYVMAHELGHLLLPPHSHSAVGLMRATLDLELAATRHLYFTREQAALIVGKVEETAAYTAAARPQNFSDASRAPSAIAASFPQTTSGSTAAWPTQVP